MKSLTTIIATLILLTNLTVAAPTGQNHNPQDWPLGISAWSFKEFSFFDAVEKTAALDLKNIEAYQGQKLYNDSDLKITGDLDDRSITKIKAKLDKHNVTLTSIYIHSIPPDKAEHIFRFCKKLGVKTIVGEPKKEHLDVIEKFCDKYEINLAIHNHATGKSDYSDPKEVARVCAGRSERIGACADTGHWQRSGFDPVECLRILEGRIISVHPKDLNKTEPKGHDVPWGTGKGQIVKTLSELKRQKVNPTIIAIEYEHNFDNSTPDIKKCIQFYNKTIAELADPGCVAGNNLAIYQEFLNDTAPTIVETVAEYTKDGVYVHKLKFLSRVSAGQNVIIYGILCKPVGDGPYPGLLNVHGGGGYADQMFSQVFDWAKRGYVAFCQDQPGICSFADMRSSGPFTSRDNFTVDPDATYSRLFDGVVAGLNGLRFIRSQPETDVNNVGVTGGSWGGYMTTMMSGLGQDRFKASFSVYGCGYYDVGSTWADEIESLDADDRIKWLDALDAGRKASQIQSNFFLTSPTNDWYFWPSGMMATFNDITSPKNFAIAANAMHYLTRGAGFHGGTDSSRAQPHRTYMEIQWMDYHLKGIGDPFGSCTAGTVTRDGNNARVEFTYTGVNPEENALIYYAYGETPFNSNYWRSVPVTSQGGGTYSGLIPIYDTELPIIWFGSAHDTLGADLREYTCSTTYQTFNPTALGFTAAERRDEYFVEDFEGNKERWKKPTFKSYPGNYTYGSTAAHSGSYGLRLTGEQTLRCDGMRGAAWEKFADGIKMWVKNPGGTSFTVQLMCEEMNSTRWYWSSTQADTGPDWIEVFIPWTSFTCDGSVVNAIPSVGEPPMELLSDRLGQLRFMTPTGCDIYIDDITIIPRDPAQAADPHQLYVGWATQNITPDKPVALDGQFKLRVSRKTLDPVTCTALAIETRDGSKSVETAIMVSCDFNAIREVLSEEVKRVLKSQLPDFDLNKLLLNSTHTHAAPVLTEGKYEIPKGVITPTEYVRFAAGRIAKAAVEAWNSRKPAGMSWGLGQAAVGYNRRAVYFKPVPSGFGTGTAVMYGKTNREDFSSIEGYEDHGLEMMFLWDERKKLTGIVLNIASPAQETEGIEQLSADFWHEVRVELHKRYGNDVYIFAQCAAAGDISPHLLWRKKAEMEMLRRKGISRRQEIALRIANAVDDVFPYVQKTIKTKVIFQHFVDEFKLPVRKVTEEEMRQSETLAEQQQRPRRAKWHRTIIDRYNQQEDNPYHSARVHVIRLGDIAIASNPFELFFVFGLRIQTRSKAVLTFVVQLAGPGTYVPTAKAEAGGGYSAIVQSNLVGSEGGQILVNETVKRINSMWESSD